MKKAILTILILGLLIFGCTKQKRNIETEKDLAPQYTYDGEFNPDDFMYWKVVEANRYFENGYLYICMILKNPDPESSIEKIVAICIYIDSWILIAYAYTDKKMDYIYMLDFEQNHYKLFNKQPSKFGFEKIKYK